MYKKIILIAVLLLQLSLWGKSHAQKYCDLSVSVLTPIDGAVIAPGDTAFVSYRIMNWGPDTLTVSDTLSVYLNGYYFWYVAEEILPGQFFDELMLGVWQGDEEADDTLVACLAIEPYGHVSFVDTVPINDTSCSSFILKGNAPVDNIKAVKNRPDTLKLHPNPATLEVFFTPPGKHKAVFDVFIYDITGRLVIAKAGISRRSDQEVKVDISQLHSGIYLLKMYDGKGISCGKLVVR